MSNKGVKDLVFAVIAAIVAVIVGEILCRFVIEDPYGDPFWLNGGCASVFAACVVSHGAFRDYSAVVG